MQIKSIFKTISDDVKTLVLAFKIAFYRVDKNPLYLAEKERQKRETKKTMEIEEKMRELERNYRKSLEEDGHEDFEIEEQMMASRDFIRQKAEILSYEFWPCRSNELTKIEIEVKNAMERCHSRSFNLRVILFGVVLIWSTVIVAFVLS